MKKCSNCRCDIEESKIVLHERFCTQNIKFCDICQEAIIKEEYEEHCLEHKNNDSEKKEIKPEEERKSLSLNRVMSTKIQCEFCQLFLSFSEVEEHEEMCGSRSTKCKICGERIILKNLENHILSIHGLNKSIYNECDSLELNNKLSDLSLNKNQFSSQQSFNLNDYNFNNNNLGLYNMTSSEQIAYALALSEQENNLNQNKNVDKNESNNQKNEENFSKKEERPKDTEKVYEKDKKEVKSEEKNDIMKKKSSFNYDDIEYEYEKNMYEEEMKTFGKD